MFAEEWMELSGANIGETEFAAMTAPTLRGNAVRVLCCFCTQVGDI